jgi:hypothetical protein
MNRNCLSVQMCCPSQKAQNIHSIDQLAIHASYIIEQPSRFSNPSNPRPTPGGSGPMISGGGEPKLCICMMRGLNEKAL